MTDWSVVNVPSVLDREVATYDYEGNLLPDPGEWHRLASEVQYVLAEFLASKSLIKDDLDVSRRPDLIILHSQLTEHGKAFEMSQAIHKWMASLDKRRSGTPVTPDGLERRWRKWAQAQMQ